MPGPNDPIEIAIEPSIGHYRMGTSIGGVHYLIDLRWNASSNIDRFGVAHGAWMIDFFEEDETPIIKGCKLALGVIIGRRCRWHPLFRDGLFVCVDMTNSGLDAGFDDIGPKGGRVALQYMPVLEAIRRTQDYA